MVSAIAGGLAAGAAGALLGGGGGGGSTQARPQIVPFDAGGISTRFNEGVLTAETSAERQSLINALAQSFRTQAQQVGDFGPQFRDIFQTQQDELGGLREQLQPGFGALTKARLDEIETGRQRALGNLRESLAKRRVQGSSFGQSLQVQAEREFSQASGEARARSVLEELDATQRIIDLQFQTGLQSLNTSLQLLQTETSLERAGTEVEIQEQNRLVDIVTQLQSGVQSTLNQAAQFNAQAAQQSLSGAGQFFGQSGIPQAIGQAAGQIFNPSRTSGGFGTGATGQAGTVFFPGSGTTVNFPTGRIGV